MKTVTLTDSEMETLSKALTMYNDMMDDIALGDLWIREGETVTYTSEQLKNIRKDIDEGVNELINLALLKNKLGITE